MIAPLKGKTVMKTGMQFGEHIIDAKFWKPAKQKNSFRSVACAVRDSVE